MDALAGFLQLPFSFLDVSLALSSFRPRFRLNKAMMVQEKRGESWRAEMGEQRRAGAARAPSRARHVKIRVRCVHRAIHRVTQIAYRVLQSTTILSVLTLPPAPYMGASADPCSK